MDFTLFKMNHRGNECLGVRLSREDSRNSQIRTIPGIKWSRTHCCWYEIIVAGIEPALPKIFNIDTDDKSYSNKQLLGDASLQIENISFESENKSTFPDENIKLEIGKFKQHLSVLRYSPNSIQNYTNAIIEFLKYFSTVNWRDLDEGDMENFQKVRIIDRNLSQSYQNSMISAIKIFYQVNAGIKKDPGFIKRPRTGRYLPRIFSQEQVAKLINSTLNQKHRMMLSIGYGCGLRSGEVVKLRPEDINSERKVLFIRGGKGNKDRMIPLSEKLINYLREYYKIYRPSTWLFEGQIEGVQYSQRSLQLVYKNAVIRNKFDPKFRFHDLRHSYATHIMEAGTNQIVIQKLLGHKSIRTTEIYTHVSRAFLEKVYNPFDALDI